MFVSGVVGCLFYERFIGELYFNLYLHIKIKINILLTNGLKTPLMFKNALVLVFFVFFF